MEDAARYLNAVAATRRLTPDVVYYLANVLAARDRADDAIKLLRGILDSTGPQVYRAESQKLYDTLQAASNSSSE